MPITLNDLTANVPVMTFTPKFFDSKLTGTGKKIGLLNEHRNPRSIDPAQNTMSQNIDMYKHHYSNGQADVSFIPFYIITPSAWNDMNDIAYPNPQDMTCIATKSINGGSDVNAYVTMETHSAILEEIVPQYKNGPIKKNLTMCYRLSLWVIADSNVARAENVGLSSAVRRGINGHNAVYVEFTCNPARIIDEMKKMLENMNYKFDDNAAFEFIDQYDLYDDLCRRSEEWQTNIHNVLNDYFEQMHMRIGNGACSESEKNAILNEVTRVLRRIEDYNVPLDLYRHIYRSVVQFFDPDDATVLCKQNLNLLLSDTLNNLNQNKSQLTCLPTPAQPVQIDPYFSREQRDAITTKEPLVLVQAGAGTGKSTVVLARIKHMVDCGIPPQDITVLSFTNAAADHITDKNPYVHSMTIASMIHTIYTTNFKDHELSSIDTIINSLDIYFPNDDFAYEFRGRLQRIQKNDRDSFTRMNNFIERNYDKVMQTLDTIRQTSLELEIIICYQQIENLVEPPEVKSRYLIIDEVQDNSIFEFVYTLKYVDKHKESLFMVGDCSQTLYEFRASNPKALNVLEGSGVFATYQLQTNYRSNQEILDFANVTLSDIEANQYAHIQLQANSLAPVTEQSFTDKVHLHYERLNRITDFKEALHGIFATKVYKFIDAKLKAGEQIAFLSYTRFQVNLMQEIVTKMYPNATVANLVPDKVYNATVFSEFIKRYWSDIKFVPTRSIMVVISQEIIHRLDFLVYDKNKSLVHVQKLLTDWVNENRATIDVWQKQHMSGQMSLDELLTKVRNNMLDYEIRHNAIRQSLVSARNQQNKQNQNVATANFLFSTIHSAKGLEFENTVVIYQAKNDMDEEKKRMYYVAFTRAMKSEFIIAYDTVVTPKIQADYDAIVENLRNKAAATAAGTVVDPSNGVEVVNLGTVEDDLEAIAQAVDDVSNSQSESTS